MKTLLVYNTIYGSTKEYAELISKSYSADIVSVKDIDSKIFEGYDVVIFGSPVRFMRIPVKDSIYRFWDVLKSKELILFTTSALDRTHTMIKWTFYMSFPEPSIRARMRFFPLGGRLVQSGLSEHDKSEIARAKEDMGNSIKGSEDLLKDDVEIILKALTSNIDAFDFRQVETIVSYLSELEEKYDDEVIYTL